MPTAAAKIANKIAEVVRLISDIAAQTRLLALHVTNEAARAGGAGKGFALVAPKVKSLASQTAKAINEIGSRIAGVCSVTRQAVPAITLIRGTIDEANGVATTIAAIVEQQGTVIQEIALNTQLASAPTRDATASVTAVTVETLATASTAEAVKTAATCLGTQATRLRARSTVSWARSAPPEPCSSPGLSGAVIAAPFRSRRRAMLEGQCA